MMFRQRRQWLVAGLTWGSTEVVMVALLDPRIKCMSVYTGEFFDSIRDNAQSSAKVILPIVFDLLHPSSVIDVGCGTGAFLAVAEELGALRLVGIEGEWAPSMSKSVDFRVHDLEQPLPALPQFDLAICLEVAEHISPERGPAFVSELCHISECTLFSAAIPDQPGTNHVNCRWQSYWMGLFEKKGRTAVDVIRPAIWERDDVPYWYKQNTLLFLSNQKLKETGLESKRAVMRDIVHPTLVPIAVSQPRDLALKQVVQQLPSAVFRAAKRIIFSQRH